MAVTHWLAVDGSSHIICIWHNICNFAVQILLHIYAVSSFIFSNDFYLSTIFQIYLALIWEQFFNILCNISQFFSLDPVGKTFLKSFLIASYGKKAFLVWAQESLKQWQFVQEVNCVVSITRWTVYNLKTLSSRTLQKLRPRGSKLPGVYIQIWILSNPHMKCGIRMGKLWIPQ